MESVKRLVSVLFRPSAVFEYLREHPYWVAPLVLILLSTIIFTAVSASIGTKIAMKEFSKRASDLPPDQLEQAKKMISSPITIVMGVIGGLVVAILAWLIQAAIFHFLASAFGGSGKFINSLSVVGYSWVPIFLREVLQTVFMLTTGRLFQPGLTALVAPPSGLAMPGMLYIFLSSIDLFVFWNLILLIIGFSVVYRISKVKSAIMVIGYWLAGVLLGVGLAFIGQSFVPPPGGTGISE